LRYHAHRFSFRGSSFFQRSHHALFALVLPWAWRPDACRWRDEQIVDGQRPAKDKHGDICHERRLVRGVAAPVAGLVGLGVLLYWASIYYVGPDKGGDFSRADLYGVAPTLPLFVGVTLLGLVVAIGAALHALTRIALGRALLWLATLLLAAATALAFAGVDTLRYLSLAGPYLTPALMLASLASLISLASAGRVHTAALVR
jgi:hypothetical protein